MKYVAIVTEMDTDQTYTLCEAETYDLLIENIKNKIDYVRFNNSGEQFRGCIFVEDEYDEGDGYYEPYCYEIPIYGYIDEAV